MKVKHSFSLRPRNLGCFFFLRRSICCLMMFFLCGIYTATGQVNINYAAADVPLYYSNQNNFTISGKRIQNMDTSVYSAQCLTLYNCNNVIISDCILGPSFSSGIYLFHCSNITIQNCIFVDNGNGVMMDAGCDQIKVNNNQYMNLHRGGDSGYQGHFVHMLRVSNGSGCQINGNVGENKLGYSRNEDIVNVGGSTFSSSSPLEVIGNRFRGEGSSPSSSGIIVGDDGDSLNPDPVSGPALIKNNIMVNPGSVGIWVTGASNVFEDNIVFGDLRPTNNGGLLVGSARVTCPTLTIKRNKVTYWHGLNGNNYFQPLYAPGCMTNVTWGTGSDANDFNATYDESVLPRKLLGSFLVSYHKFASDWNDYSGSGLSATPHGSTITCDNVRKAASFNGTSSDWIEIARSPHMKPTMQKITVSTWIKPASLSNHQAIACSQDGGGNTEGWRMAMNNTDFVTRIVTDSGIVSVTCSGLSTSQWSMVSFTYDGTILKGYVNGVLVDSSVLAGNITYSSTASGMMLGMADGINHFNGMIAEVKLWYGDRSADELYSDWYNTAGMFDGSMSNPDLTVSASYYANGQSKVLSDFDGVLANSNGEVVSTSGYANASWQLLLGNPIYNYPAGNSDFISIPDLGAAQLRLTVSEGACMLPAWRDFTLFADLYQPFRVKLIPGTGEIIVSKVAPETPASPSLPNGLRNLPAVTGGTYTIQVVNVLGQVIKAGFYKDGQLTLNIGDAIPGVYVVRVLNKGRTVYTTKIVK